MVRSVGKIRGETAVSPLPTPFKFLMLLVLAVGLVFAFKHFQDGYEKVDGEWVMKPEFRDKVDDKRESFEECEVYFLMALEDGFYDCPNCTGKTFYLYSNEIAKIGMTCNGRDRYDQSFYQAKKVRYEVVFKGNAYECQREEIRLLGSYAQMPENMRRPDRTKLSLQTHRYKLLYPVFNTTLK